MNIETKLDKLYSLREDFSILGITGRTGSGCTEVANVLSMGFAYLNNLNEPELIAKSMQDRQYEIVYNFNRLNWKSYRVIKYRNILLLLLANSVKQVDFRTHLKNYYLFSNKDDVDLKKIQSLHKEIDAIITSNQGIIEKLSEFGDLRAISDRDSLKALANFFWNEFEEFSSKIDEVLLRNGIVERIKLLHHTAGNYRKSGQPYKIKTEDYNSIYFIAEVINRIIKGTRILSNTCHIVIDSLRNSLEINFFKERYSGFYLIAVKSDERKKRLMSQYNNDETLVDRILELDETEYKATDFVKGKFFAPDVQNCIQKADYHLIVDNDKTKSPSIERQLLKLQGLIQQPGLISPDSAERCMQLAFNAKLSSGCISRQVGAVITDSDYSIKAIGWNDVPKGAVPCAMRNVLELDKENSFGFSEFEKGKGLSESSSGFNIGNPDNREIDKESKAFHEFIKSSYDVDSFDASDLAGINCAYCFKSAYNKFKGESNQVHTRSLHAEENAMLQISKYGGQPLKNGYLFTTASPCELCSKKAYQLGVTEIYYIDPYPGISRSHILRQGPKIKENGVQVSSDPNLQMFSGAIGRGYIKLYEPFMAQKDEIAILTGHKFDTPESVKIHQLKEMLKEKMLDKKGLAKKLDTAIHENDGDAIKIIVNLIEKGLSA